jgi:Pectate lyase superfamily protein
MTITKKIAALTLLLLTGLAGHAAQTITNVNTGTSGNSGNGDPLRTAFTKINTNFTFLTTYGDNGPGQGGIFTTPFWYNYTAFSGSGNTPALPVSIDGNLWYLMRVRTNISALYLGDEGRFNALSLQIKGSADANPDPRITLVFSDVYTYRFHETNLSMEVGGGPKNIWEQDPAGNLFYRYGDKFNTNYLRGTNIVFEAGTVEAGRFRPDKTLTLQANQTNLASNIYLDGDHGLFGFDLTAGSYVSLIQVDGDGNTLLGQSTATGPVITRKWLLDPNNGIAAGGSTAPGAGNVRATNAVFAKSLIVTNTATASNVVDSLNVKYWGAVGNGVADDTTAIQAAVDAAAAVVVSSNRTVLIPAGRYKTTAQITLGSNIRLTGDGPSTIIDNVTTNTYIITCDGGHTNVVIENLAVIGHGVFDNSTAGRAAVKLTHFGSSRGSSAVIRNIWIYDSGVTGLGVDQWDDVFIENVFVYNAAEHGAYVTLNNNVQIANLLVVSNRFGNGLKMVGNTNVVASHCTFRGTENAGGLFDTDNLRCAFESCSFENNVLQGVRMNSGNLDCAIRTCTFFRALQDEIRCTGGTNTSIVGNRLYPINRGIVCDAAVVLPIITGNWITNGDGAGISVNSRSIIQNNTVIGSLSPALEINTLSTNTIVSGNALFTPGAAWDFGVGTIVVGQMSGITTPGRTNILFSSRVAIGGTDPQATLDVTGDIIASTTVTASSGYFNAAVKWVTGSASPEGAVTAPVGSLYSRTGGGAGTSFYVKESGSGNTGWVAK